ncbi:uncharacterized protein LOC142542454 [Primulina tabacum]|uniref:uncharacterized protein LOC142542454 n=1 Tax=Primulina tabacum TaxID=48773 RepID=UPI003F5A9979
MNMTKPNPKKLIQETLHITKKFLNRTVIKTLKSLYKNLPKTSRSDPIFPDNSSSSKISFKNQKLHNICMKRDAPFTGQTKDLDEEKCVTDHSKSSDLKREENARKKSSSFRGAEALAKEMKEFEMMDIDDDQDQTLDIEEVLHNYSQLSCPAYLEIVDKFFMDMYTELLVPLPLGSVNSSMRKMGSVSVHSSMRSLGPIKLYKFIGGTNDDSM